MAAEPATELSFGDPGVLAADDPRDRVAGLGPWRLALRRLRRNKISLAFGALFVVLVLICLAAPLWADHVAHSDAFKNHLTEQIKLGGKLTDVVAPDGVPIGPTWHGRFFLGADGNGRDIAVRLLYGGRTSLLIGAGAAIGTILLSILLGTIAGYFRGFADTVISRGLDILWAFPPLLLGLALGTTLALGGLAIGPIHIPGDSKLIPILIISIVQVPYMARPLRGQVLALREKEFIEAARAQGAGPLQIMFSEILPNLVSTIVVFFPLMVVNAIGLEAALSFLGAGVRPPNPSWGTLLGEGISRIVTAPHQTIVPGLMLVLTVLSLNVFGDGVRDAFDPRANLGESGVAARGGVITERRVPTVVGSSQLLDRNVLRRLDDPIANLLGRIDARVYRRDDSDKNLLVRSHVLLDDLQHPHAILFAGEGNTEVADVQLEQQRQEFGVVDVEAMGRIAVAARTGVHPDYFALRLGEPLEAEVVQIDECAE